MRHSKLLFITALMLTASAHLHAEQVDWELTRIEKVQNPPARVSLEYKLKNNDSRRFELTVAGEGAIKLPGEKEQSQLRTNSKLLLNRHTAAEQSGDGIWRIEWNLISGSMSVPDFREFPLSIPKIEVEMDKYGAVRTLKGLENPTAASGLPADAGLADVVAQLKWPGFPQKPLRPGDEWEQQFKVHNVDVKTTSQLVGFERIDKRDCAKIRTIYETPFNFPVTPGGGDAASTGMVGSTLVGTEKGEFFAYFDYTEGDVVQTHGTVEIRADVRPSDAAEAERASADAKAPSESKQNHDLNVRYHIVSKLAHEVSAEERKSE